MILEKKMIMSNCEANNNKFWTAIVNDDFTVTLFWGRIGNESVSSEKKFPSQQAATKFVESKVKEKTKKGYVELKTVDTKVTITPTSNLAEIAKTQIIADTEIQKLISYLTEVNAHNILSSTTLTLQEDTGLFSTPLGIVTKESIDHARKLLNEISEFVTKNQFKDKTYIKLLNEYLTVIPQRIGRRLDPETLYKNLNDIKKQNDILDSLEVTYKTYSSKEEEFKKQAISKVDIPKIFSCELIKVTDQLEIDRLTKKFNESLNGSHSSSKLKPKSILSVKIDSMHESFNINSNKIGNIKELWHGTRASNLLSILKSGLIIPPKSNPNVTGRMFGDGLYFSDQSTKALNYSYGYWDSGKRDNNCFMFIADVAMGKEYLARFSSEKFPIKGYDSTFAKGGYSGVQNNEMIVYNTYQVNLKYLIEFN